MIDPFPYRWSRKLRHYAANDPRKLVCISNSEAIEIADLIERLSAQTITHETTDGWEWFMSIHYATCCTGIGWQHTLTLLANEENQ